MINFNDLNIRHDILKGIEKKKFTEMTSIQEKVIPIAIEKKDIIAQAPTGTGKTVAFAIPILETIDINNPDVQAIILSPTRELTMQTANEIKEVAHYMKKIGIVSVYGGENIQRQISALKRKTQIVVATPGRLMDHLRRKTISLDNVKCFVLDEADVMLDMGFREDIDVILQSIKNNPQKMLFSATLSKEILDIARKYLKNPESIRTTNETLTVQTIKQYYVQVSEKNKIETISRFMNVNGYQLAIVFCNTKRMVDEVSADLSKRGFSVEALHGDMKQMQRDRVMQRFKNGDINILVASDVAARGLDIDDVEVVFNYDVPTDEEYYVHRIGRTGRAKKTGVAISLVTRQENYRLRSIIAFSKANIERLEIPSWENVLDKRIEDLLIAARDISSNSVKVDNTLDGIISSIDNENKDELIKGLLLLQLGNVDQEIEREIYEESSRSSHTRLFFNIGRKDRIRKYTLSDLVIKNTNLKNKDINNIDIYDSFSFLEIPSKYANEVISELSKVRFQGQPISVEEAKDKGQTKSNRRKRRYDKRR